MKKRLLFTFSVCISLTSLKAQVITAEDSLYAGLIHSEQKTVISGYGEAKVGLDFKQRDAEASLRRVILFVGHKFSNKISLFTEMEIENALVSSSVGSNAKGEIAMEQAFLKFNINPNHYFVAGLFLPRIGIINENHLPTTFNGVDRPYVEQFVIPSTWRNIGIGYYGTSNKISGLNYTASIMSGLNSQQFENGTGIRNGRQQGSNATGMNMALNASALYYLKNYRLQASSYLSGSTALEGRVADSLQLSSGPLANPVWLNEINLQYRDQAFELRLLGAYISIPNASNINLAFANNTPSSVLGTYAEISYDFLYHKKNNRSLIAFTRAEFMDLNFGIANNGIENKANKKTYLLAGLTYKPLKGVALKMDYTIRKTGNQNPILNVTPFPQVVPYFTNKNFLNFGISYNF